MSPSGMLRDIRVHAVLSSFLLSAVTVMLKRIPNDDSFTYLRTAELFLDEGIVAAFQHYPWAAHSILIAIVQSLPGVSLLAAAQILNAVWFAVVTAGFISVVRLLDTSKRVSLLAAITVLAYPHLNEFRFSIIRDIAFLGLALWAVFWFLRYYRSGRAAQAAGFCACLVAGALFRAEALVFLLLAPLSMLVHPTLDLRQRLQRLGVLWGMAALFPLLAVSAFTLAGIDLWQQLQTVAGVYLPFLQETLNELGSNHEAIRNALFNDHAARHSSEYTGLIVFTGLLALLGSKLLESLGWTGGGILAYGLLKRHVSLAPLTSRPWLAWAGIALLILAAFTLVARFMTTRYTLFFGMLLMLLVPLIVDRLWEEARRNGQMRWFSWVFGLILAYSAVDSHISFGEPKSWLPDTLEWLESQQHGDPVLVTNERYIAWRSGLIDAYDEVRRNMPVEPFLSAPEGALLVVEREPALFGTLEAAEQDGLVRELTRFEDRHGTRIIIYRRQ